MKWKHDRVEHIAKRLERDRLARINTNSCINCNLRLKWCICNSLPKVRGEHSCSVILNHLEVSRSTSTHKILQFCLGSDVYINDYTGDIATIWRQINEKCKKTGQKPVILFPNRDAMTPTEIYNSMAPEERKNGLHIVAIDGSWSEARNIIRGIQLQMRGVGGTEATAVSNDMEEPTFCIVQPTVPHTLFQPLRKQPHPNRISTVEAVACIFDEWWVAANTREGESKTSALAPCHTNLIKDMQECNIRAGVNESVEDPVNEFEAGMGDCNDAGDNSGDTKTIHQVHTDQFQYLEMPHVHDELIPSFPTHQSRQLRYALCTLVDRVCRQSGLIAPGGRGTGYRTWNLNRERSGYFGKIPAWIVEKIAVAAYGRENVLESGYHVRTAKFTKHWESIGVIAGQHGMESHRDMKNVEVDEDNAATSPLEWRYKIRLCQGGLPRPMPPYTATPLALCNSDLYCLFAGMWKV